MELFSEKSRSGMAAAVMSRNTAENKRDTFFLPSSYSFLCLFPRRFRRAQRVIS